MNPGKCAIIECPNKVGEGLFIGTFCAPCYHALTEPSHVNRFAARRIITSLIKHVL